MAQHELPNTSVEPARQVGVSVVQAALHTPVGAQTGGPSLHETKWLLHAVLSQGRSPLHSDQQSGRASQLKAS